MKKPKTPVKISDHYETLAGFLSELYDSPEDAFWGGVLASRVTPEELEKVMRLGASKKKKGGSGHEKRRAR